MIDGKLIAGDIEVHFRQQDWYGHGHHLDPTYDQCILHLVFTDPSGTGDVRCHNGRVPATCFIPIDRALECDNPAPCKIFYPDLNQYFKILKKSGWERIRGKIKYFYDNRLRFPGDVMLYWGLFKACGYRYNEENMIKLFVRFPWAAYCDGLLDRRDILPMLNDLAGFSGNADPEYIRWTRSRTRPGHFPENRVDWIGKLMTHYYGASLLGIIYDLTSDGKDIFKMVEKLFQLPQSNPPGNMIRNEMIMNTILPLMEAVRMENNDNKEIKKYIMDTFESARMPVVYGVVKKFHDDHGISPYNHKLRYWLISQGVLHIRNLYCSQGARLKCPVCLLDPSGETPRND
jgi:hypothetical protein